jgi:hypothetical protein
MKMTDGLLTAKRPRKPAPKDSPEGFKWPDQRDGDQDAAEKIAASLQELLPAKGMKHTDLARALWGTAGANGAPRNTGTARRWVLAELPIPNEEAAGYIAELLDVSMARLLKPNGKFNPNTDMIRDRSPNGVNKAKMGNKKAKKAAKKAGGRNRDVEKQRAYNAAYRKRQKEAKAGKQKRKYTRRAPFAEAAAEGNGMWKLGEGVSAPEYKITSDNAPAGHVNFELTAILPHERAMAILHMLQHEKSEE